MTIVVGAPQVYSSGEGEPVLAVRGLTKRFADVLACDHLDLAFSNGEIHAVLGENGAGKSTLVKMLYGFYKPDEGEISLDGQRAVFHSPADARQKGIGMVFQSFTLIPAFTVLENIALVTQDKGFHIKASALARDVEALSRRYNLEVDPAAYVRDLSIGEQQRVEILKLLACSPRILILDEPTSVLAPHEVASLLEIVRRLRDDGMAIILITHKLGEVFACANRVSVLRRGQIVGSGAIEDFDQRSLLTSMLGERAANESDPVAVGAAPLSEGFRLRDVSLRNEDGRLALNHVDLEVSRGEIVGVAAVSGNGQAYLGEALLGASKLTHGQISIGGQDMTKASPAKRLASGLAIVPEDPIHGSVAEMTVQENMTITKAASEGRRLLLRPGAIARAAATAVAQAPFPLPALTRRLGTLSGGNIQRVVLARELNDSCNYLLAYYPTRGLDVTSSRAVRQRLIDLKDRGGAVLLVSEDLDELRALSDRIVVFYHGSIVGTFKRGDVDVFEIGRLMTGGHAS